jgi:4a-hydroxytetrahydrobiopterin dehydratase
VSSWDDSYGALERTFEFESFAEAVAFVNRVAELAEAENHHPDIAISYKKVTLRWTTHSAGGITERGFMDTTRYLIVGGGMTAAAAIDGMRSHDADGGIVLVGGEQHPPYKRPPLS